MVVQNLVPNESTTNPRPALESEERSLTNGAINDRKQVNFAYEPS